MKIGVDEVPLSEVDAKLVRAAAITHRETRLAIASHTSRAEADVDGSRPARPVPACHRPAFIWVHRAANATPPFGSCRTAWCADRVRRVATGDRSASRRSRARNEDRGTALTRPGVVDRRPVPSSASQRGGQFSDLERSSELVPVFDGPSVLRTQKFANCLNRRSGSWRWAVIARCS